MLIGWNPFICFSATNIFLKSDLTRQLWSRRPWKASKDPISLKRGGVLCFWNPSPNDRFRDKGSIATLRRLQWLLRGSRKLNIKKGIDRIALVIAIHAILPSFIVGHGYLAKELITVTPEYKEWKKTLPLLITSGQKRIPPHKYAFRFLYRGIIFPPLPQNGNIPTSGNLSSADCCLLFLFL